MAETAECPTCTCGLCRYDPERRCWYNASGNPDWHDIWPGNYCPRCGDLLGEGTTTPPATAEQLRDAEAMAALREHRFEAYPSRGRDEVEPAYWQIWVRPGHATIVRAGDKQDDPAAAILLAAQRLTQQEGEPDEHDSTHQPCNPGRAL